MPHPDDRQTRETTIPFACETQTLRAVVTPEQLGIAPTQVWNPSPSSAHRGEPYDLPQTLTVGVRGDALSASKFSPPPFAVILESADGRRVLINVAADAGWHRWNAVEFESRAEGVTVTIDLQGRTSPREASKHVQLLIVPAEPNETRHALLQRGLQGAYPETASPATVPDWWRRPIYCGWGDQVATAFFLEGADPRGERRALAYCTQGLYQRWIDRLVDVGVPVGTVIIDHGWSPAGWWQPNEILWPDLKGFIARQHDAGRRVLLWLATWLTDGLPDEWCVFADGRKLTSDPTNPAYLAQAQQWVHELISPDGYDADGFKVDQLAYVPDVRRAYGGARFGFNFEIEAPSTVDCHDSDSAWGCEMLHRLQKAIHDAAKRAKPDALITSSTVHPYFHDTFDMVRLHDTGTVSEDVLAAMGIRTALAQAALPGKPIDADDWVTRDYEAWMYYTLHNHQLGVPCIFYSDRFMENWDHEPATRPIPEKDLRRIAGAWADYIDQLESNSVAR
ncbi:MAG: hypothetical protein ACODAQ_11255 [Phycisphaeraceae bacterium]